MPFGVPSKFAASWMSIPSKWLSCTRAAHCARRSSRAFLEFNSHSLKRKSLVLSRHASPYRTPPDWWRELRKEEERRRWQADRSDRAAATSQTFNAAFDTYLETEAREAFGRVMDRIFQDLRAAGQSDDDASEHARQFTRTHFLNRFRAEHPQWKDDGPTRPGGIL